MSLNLPMLFTNAQPSLEPWNPVSQLSPPPITDRSQLRVPLPLPFSAASSQNELNTSGGAASVGGGSSLGGGGNGGTRSLFEGSSNNSDYDDSPHKPMDTTDDNDEVADNGSKNEDNGKCECPSTGTPSNLHHDSSINSNDGRLSTGPNGTPGDNGTANNGSGNVSCSSGGGGGGGGGGGLGVGRRSDGNSGTDAGSSPIPNTNTFEAHKQRHLLPGATVSTPSRGDPHSDDLDIKQELLENYFHAPHPPAPPESHRSYSSTDENRHNPESADEFAQDLRMNAAAAAAAKGLDFSRFVLPPNLRRSTDSIDEKFTPLNMRKLNAASTTSSAAGQMLMSSLISSESMSEDNNTSVSGSGGGRLGGKSGSNGNANGLSGANSQDASSSAAAAAAAAAIYAESLNKDDCDFIGSNVSVKLRTMDRTQRIIAEKLISEVLYYGQFNELERSARIQPK